MLKLGSEVKDKITQFSGVVVARDEWFNGCVRYGVQSKELHDGKPVAVQWLDEAQLTLTAEPMEIQSSKRRGGPMSDPPVFGDSGR